MAISRNGSVELTLPTQAREVFDVSGAGDTVIATLTAALASGATAEEAAKLANLAAGVVVSRIGTATVTSKDLFGIDV
jgi:D-beta-D-heptose 7-phosphate kinase/D-beta-D-heptose 1-phosphate adenosyltransferase